MSWVIRLAVTDAASLAPLRLTRGIEVAEKEPFIWVRGPSGDEKIERLLRALPAAARYEVTAGNRLRNLESRIPAETLPALNWQPVNTWLRVQMPSMNPVEARPGLPGSAGRAATGDEAVSHLNLPEDGNEASLGAVPLRII